MARFRPVTNSEAKQDTNFASFGSHCQINSHKYFARSARRSLAQLEWSRTPLVAHASLISLMLVIYKHPVVCEDVLTLRIAPSSFYLEEMKPASLVCSMSASADYAALDFPLSWSRTGGLPYSAMISGSQKNNSGSTFYESKMAFTPTALDNLVVFVCSAKVGPVTGSASYAPNIILIPEAPVIIAPDRAEVSGSYTWACRSDGASQVAPNVYWRNGLGEPLTTGVRRVTTIRTRPNLNIVYSITVTITLPYPTAVAGDILTCTAVHQLGQYSSRKTTAQAVSLPQVAKLGGDLLYSRENVRQTISCVVVATSPPAMIVSWTKNGEPVSLQDGRYEGVNTSAPSLTISSVQRSDQGDYVCVLTNPVGTASFTTPTTLVVRYPPSIHYPENMTTFHGNTGAALTIPCPVESFPGPTNLLWYRILNGRVQLLNVSSDSRYSGGTVRHQNYGVTINSLEGKDAGTYFCEAFNNVGAGAGRNLTITIKSLDVPADETSLGSSAAVAFGVVSLVLFLVILFGVIAFCYHGKCVKRRESAKVSPFMVPSDRTYRGGLFVPPCGDEASTNLGQDDDSAILPGPRTFLPPLNNMDIINSVSELSVARALRLPPLDHGMSTSAATLRWSAHLRPSLVASNGQVWKTDSDPFLSSLGKKQGLNVTH